MLTPSVFVLFCNSLSMLSNRPCSFRLSMRAPLSWRPATRGGALFATLLTPQSKSRCSTAVCGEKQTEGVGRDSGVLIGVFGGSTGSISMLLTLVFRFFCAAGCNCSLVCPSSRMLGKEVFPRIEANSGTAVLLGKARRREDKELR